MTNAAPSPDSRVTAYLQAWADALSQTMGEIAGVPSASTLMSEAPEAGAESPADFWIIAGCSGALRGEMSLKLAPAATVRLAQILMNEPATAADLTADHREAALELLRQVSGLAATEIKATRGEVQLHLEASAAAPSWPASFSGWFRVGEETPPILIEVQVSAALLASLRAEQPETAPPVASPGANPGVPAASGSHDEKMNLELLMDVELDVTLRFGGRRLLLRELLDLNPGSVIALDRQIQEPVDMLLDGGVVARGEVVVTGGNYALRVTEVGMVGA